ncbi:MAG: molybdenum cofactor guanylyltransferase [Bacillota bacterium]
MQTYLWSHGQPLLAGGRIAGRARQIFIKDAAAAILCGGKSCRMGFDKAFLMEGDAYLLQTNAQRLGSAFERVLLVSDTVEKFAPYGAFGATSAVADHYPGTGPLGGICTALEETDAPYIFVMACDMPRPDLDLIDLMRPHLGQAQVILFAHGDRLETLFAFYHRSCLPVFTERLRKGMLQPRSAFDQLNVLALPLSPERADAAFVNLNTREDLERWRAAKAGHDGKPGS